MCLVKSQSTCGLPLMGCQRNCFLASNVIPANGNSKNKRLKGTREGSRAVNCYLNTHEKKVDQAHTDLFNQGIEEQAQNLILAFEGHNDKVDSLLGKGFIKGIHSKYNTTLKYIKSF